MGKLNQGVNGPVSGKVGSVVFYQRKGKNLVRSAPPKFNNKKSTAAQLGSQSRFKLVHQIISPMLALFRLGFHVNEKNNAAYNAALSYNLLHAVREDDQGYHIDYEHFSISRNLPTPIFDTTVSVENEGVTVRWKCNESEINDKNLSSFKALLLFFTEQEKVASQATLVGSYIQSGEESLHIPKQENPVTYHGYLGFAAIDGTGRSMNSVYLGVFRI